MAIKNKIVTIEMNDDFFKMIIKLYFSALNAFTVLLLSDKPFPVTVK